MNFDFYDLIANCSSTNSYFLYIKLIKISLFPWSSLFFTRIILISPGTEKFNLSIYLYRAVIYVYREAHLHLNRSPNLKFIS